MEKDLIFSDFNELIDSIKDYCALIHTEKQKITNNKYFIISNNANIDFDQKIISDDVPRELLIRFRSLIDNTTWGIGIASFKRSASKQHVMQFCTQQGRHDFCRALNDLM